MFRLFSNVCGIVGFGLLACAGYGALFPRTDRAADPSVERLESAPAQDSGLFVENPEINLGEVSPGDHQISFRVINRSEHPGEVVGGTRACNATCCVEVQEQGRVPVPPGETATITSKLSVRNTGPFEFEGELYLNDGGQLRTVRLKITGTVAAEEKPDAPPKP